MQKTSGNRIEVGISIGSIDDGVKVSMQRHGVSADGDAEIRCVGLAFNLNSSQSAAVVAGRGKNARDPFQGSEIRVGEGIVSLNGRIARAYFVKRTELAGGLNVADWFWID